MHCVYFSLRLDQFEIGLTEHWLLMKETSLVAMTAFMDMVTYMFTPDLI